MTGIQALEILFNGGKIYKGYFKSDMNEWFVEYDKNNKTFKFGSGWIEEVKSREIKNILPYFMYSVLHDHWNIFTEY